jgi:hypothetical protein
MSGTMMTATLIHPYVVLFFVNNSASGKWNYIHQMTSKWQRCSDVAFVKRSKEYGKIATPEPFHTYLSARVKLVIEAPIVKCRKAIHALLLYFNLCASVKLNSILCYFTSLSFLTFKNKKKIITKATILIIATWQTQNNNNKKKFGQHLPPDKIWYRMPRIG